MGYDTWKTRCREHEEDDYDSRLSAFVKGHRLELNTVLDNLAALRSAANGEPYCLEDFAGQAVSCLVDGLRAAIPNMTRNTRL